jgi:hypothetical protein
VLEVLFTICLRAIMHCIDNTMWRCAIASVKYLRCHQRLVHFAMWMCVLTVSRADTKSDMYSVSLCEFNEII